MCTDNPAYETQIIVIILAPSFLAAGINLTLKHIVLTFDEGLSRLKPRQYTWIFVPVDFSCIALQAVGGGLAASAGDTGDMTILEAGNDIIVTGIVLQVVNLGESSEQWSIWGHLADDMQSSSAPSRPNTPSACAATAPNSAPNSPTPTSPNSAPSSSPSASLT